MSAHVLVVDDNFEMARMLADGLVDSGFAATPLASGAEAIAALSTTAFDAVVTDLRMPDADGMAVLAAAKRADPDRPVFVMTAFSAVDSAVEAIRRGAQHYLTKPFRVDELALFLTRALDDVKVRREAQELRSALRAHVAPPGMVAESAAMRAALDVVHRVAQTALPVLILGETGTGKGVIARALHAQSPRAQAPFVTVNCAALPEHLLESELFGHVKGAFTGALQTRGGLFAEAHGGTLFLDEIGDMALGVQAKLLHVLERGAVRPVGAERERTVDVRVVAATHRDLRAATAGGTFREDLLFRLDVVSVELPPLYARREDVVPLALAFLADARARNPTSAVCAFAPDALARFTAYRWPGNVREMKHVIERLVVLGTTAEVRVADLPPQLQAKASDAPLFSGDVMPVRRLQRLYAQWALAQLGGLRGRTAERLGVDAKTLAKWLTEDEPGTA